MKQIQQQPMKQMQQQTMKQNNNKQWNKYNNKQWNKYNKKQWNKYNKKQWNTYHNICETYIKVGLLYGEVTVLVDDTLGLLFKVSYDICVPPLDKVTVFIILTSYNESTRQVGLFYKVFK